MFSMLTSCFYHYFDHAELHLSANTSTLFLTLLLFCYPLRILSFFFKLAHCNIPVVMAFFYWKNWKLFNNLGSLSECCVKRRIKRSDLCVSIVWRICSPHSAVYPMTNRLSEASFIDHAAYVPVLAVNTEMLFHARSYWLHHQPFKILYKVILQFRILSLTGNST